MLWLENASTLHAVITAKKKEKKEKAFFNSAPSFENITITISKPLLNN